MVELLSSNKKAKMGKADRLALNSILRKEIGRLKEERPGYRETIHELSQKYDMRITHGGFDEVMKHLRYKWIPIPKLRKRCSTKPKEQLNTDLLEQAQPLLKLLAGIDRPTLLAVIELAQERSPATVPEQLKENWDSMKKERELVPTLFE